MAFNNRFFSVLVFGVVMLLSHSPFAQRSVYHGEKKTVPRIPPKHERIRVIIVSDAANEIDDIYAIAMAILHPERFDIEGFVGSNWDHTHSGIGPESVELSVQEIETILDKAGMKGKYPVYAGGHPMRYEFERSESEGVDFIIERAMAGSPDNPLWIVGLGSATDLASAYLKAPEIKDRVVMFWHARTENTWPRQAYNYNVKGDIHAARMMFHAPFPTVIFDTGTHLIAGTLEESEEYIKPYGELGRYLYEYRLKNPYFTRPDKGYFDMGDMAVLIDPSVGTWEEIDCPTVNYYMDYNFDQTNGKVLRCTNVDRDKTFKFLYDKLKANYSN